MQLTLDTGNSTYQIRSYEPGKIVVNELNFSANIIITPEKIITPWPPLSVQDLLLMHLQPLFELAPEIVLFGTGKQQYFIKADIQAAFYSKKIGIEVMNTSAACRTFNVLTAEGRKVAAALFI